MTATGLQSTFLECLRSLPDEITVRDFEVTSIVRFHVVQTTLGDTDAEFFDAINKVLDRHFSKKPGPSLIVPRCCVTGADAGSCSKPRTRL